MFAYAKLSVDVEEPSLIANAIVKYRLYSIYLELIAVKSIGSSS
jgi:hypothetical protein